MRGYIVELQPGCWIASGRNRTLVREKARVYDTRHGAAMGLAIAMKSRTWTNPKIVEVQNDRG